jgi:hypothetical protein
LANSQRGGADNQLVMVEQFEVSPHKVPLARRSCPTAATVPRQRHQGAWVRHALAVVDDGPEEGSGESQR